MPGAPPPQAVDASNPPLEGDDVCAANVESRRETFFEPQEEHLGGRAVSPARTRSSVFFPQSEQRYSRRGMNYSRRGFYDPRASERDAPEPERVRDHGDRAQRHRGARDHGRKKQAEKRIEQAP